LIQVVTDISLRVELNLQKSMMSTTNMCNEEIQNFKERLESEFNVTIYSLFTINVIIAVLYKLI